MKIPRYWAKGPCTTGVQVSSPVTGQALSEFACWGWSSESIEDAARVGTERANRVAARLASGERPDRYTYGDRPVREKVMDEWRRVDGEAFAAITLNGYGCLVLNTAGVVFVDLDYPPECYEAPGTGGLLGKLFGARKKETREENPFLAFEREALNRLREHGRARGAFGARVYRTKAGLRYLFTDAQADPSDGAMQTAMQRLGADPLYLQLCRAQDCFRARLTPKPWRCGFSALAQRYPWADAEAEASVNQWLADYGGHSEGYATCELIEVIGADTPADAEIARVVAFHDEATKADSGLPLA